ncbi:hypothetical protein L1D50_06565 [Pseudoalteromonas sp. Isolate6]|uniref:hypothetical protein n=1 Tax=Pseudoalteromonas sp. Isolate6 TaxID=2908527 RepID=UPI001EFCA2BE|nr:hypothetical protein [Pseudoalteromonas sp. Isolate6]MCG9758766.1 hypothetical protein [Pseudoalteromonas sp. Isolate6]
MRNLTALVCAFFVSGVSADERPDIPPPPSHPSHVGVDMNDLKSPELDGEGSLTFQYCKNSFGGGSSDNAAACSSAATAYMPVFIRNNNYACKAGKSVTYDSHNASDSKIVTTYFPVHCCTSIPSENGFCGNYVERGFYYEVGYSYEQSPSCPHKDFPEYDKTVQMSSDPDDIMCGKLLNPDCPAGYHSAKASAALGSAGCLPKQCDAAGQSSSLYSPPAAGVPYSGGGVYCNDGCAYNVSSENISSKSYATATSLGVACGDKPYDYKKLADEGNRDNCSTSSDDNGVRLISCSDGSVTPPDPTGGGGGVDDGNKSDPDETDPNPNDNDKPKTDCPEGDVACEQKNVQTEIENQTNDLISELRDLHNKALKQANAENQRLLTQLTQLELSQYIQGRKDGQAQQQLYNRLGDVVSAIEGIDTGGGNGGGDNDNGGGDGDGDGDGNGDCVGSPEECVGIDGEIPTEQVSLSEYISKYNGTLPSGAVLEPTQCWTIGGKNICFDWSNIIAFLQGIGYLLVMGAWIHSARIISGAL